MSNTAIHVHVLTGCCPTPLAHYLKALGILRLVAEQKDPATRGWWHGDAFRLVTKLDRSELEEFFLNDYAPTPMVAPWNGGSGFYPKDNKSGIKPIEQSTAKRFEPFRHAIASGRSVVSHLSAKPNKGHEKNDVITSCRLSWRDGALAWIDAALVFASETDPSFPALLGTGGNDGRLDFTTNLMQRLVSLFDIASPDAKPHPESIPQLSTALWNQATPTLESGAIGQFFPGAAGGPNGTSGFDGGVRVNPWDYVLMLEGAILFRSGLSRKCASERLPQASAPFAVRASGAGYGSSDSADAGARGEQWMPLWTLPSSLTEFAEMLREGRSKIENKSAQRGTDMARSVARMGVARGITHFERYGYIERNGLANLAVPLGRFDVRIGKHQDLIDEIAPWMIRFRRLASAKNAPESFGRVHRACENAMFACTRSDHPSSLLDLLIVLGQAEDQMIRSPKFSAENYATPLPKLSRRWLEAVATAEDSPELRLAISLAAQHGRLVPKERSVGVRAHWIPLNGTYFSKGVNGLNVGPEQCAIGLNLERALIAMMNRRLIALGKGASGSADDRSAHQLPLMLANQHLACSLRDIAAFLDFRVNDARLLSIARGVMAIKTRGYQHPHPLQSRSPAPLGGLATYGLLRLANPTGTIDLPGKSCISIRCNPLVFRRLQASNLSGAIQVALQQLTAAGLRPRPHVAIGSPQFARRLAASLAFGVSNSSLSLLASSLTDPQISSGEKQTLAAIAET